MKGKDHDQELNSLFLVYPANPKQKQKCFGYLAETETETKHEK
jgi:hypothetical protein